VSGDAAKTAAAGARISARLKVWAGCTCCTQLLIKIASSAEMLPVLWRERAECAKRARIVRGSSGGLSSGRFRNNPRNSAESGGLSGGRLRNSPRNLTALPIKAVSTETYQTRWDMTTGSSQLCCDHVVTSPIPSSFLHGLADVPNFLNSSSQAGSSQVSQRVQSWMHPRCGRLKPHTGLRRDHVLLGDILPHPRQRSSMAQRDRVTCRSGTGLHHLRHGLRAVVR
jgi:hypothetical protein